MTTARPRTTMNWRWIAASLSLTWGAINLLVGLAIVVGVRFVGYFSFNPIEPAWLLVGVPTGADGVLWLLAGRAINSRSPQSRLLLLGAGALAIALDLYEQAVSGIGITPSIALVAGSAAVLYGIAGYVRRPA